MKFVNKKTKMKVRRSNRNIERNEKRQYGFVTLVYRIMEKKKKVKLMNVSW